VQAILDQLQEELYGDADDPQHHNQITLYRRRIWAIRACPGRCLWYWPWGKGRFIFSGWLIPVARSGHGKKRSRSIYLAPDDLDNAEGIAGVVWAFGKKGQAPAPIEDLPQITVTSSVEDKELYAKKTFIPFAWVEWYIRKKRSLPRSYAGRPIEVSGEMWGVLVIDSRKTELPYKPKLEKATRTAAKLLAVTLKGT
jgi:hypothetical protein